MKTNGKIKTLSVSDCHLGNRLGTTEHIISNLNKLLPDSNKLADVDLLILAGDVFDEGIYLSDVNTATIQIWMVRVLTICKKWNIILRILEGTPSHDRKQSKQFIILNEALGLDINIRYIDELYIEYIEDLKINILYVPDEWRADNNQTQQEVISLLKKNNLEKVDYAIMHGCFEHQLPKMKEIPFHSAEFYLSIVKKYIFIGHVHIPSRFDRILAQGSTDRLAHNEEHDKGMFCVEAYNESNELDIVSFIANPNPTIFKTISIIGLSKLEAEVLLKDTIIELSTDKYKDTPKFIRILCEKQDGNEDTVASYKQIYTNIKWSIKHIDTSKTQISDKVTPTIFQPTIINENTILHLMKTRLENIGIDNNILQQSLEILNKLKGQIR